MRFHPAVFMLMVWGTAFAALIILPFELTYRTITPQGMMVLITFILVFCLGAVLRTAHVPQQPVASPEILKMGRADLLLKVLAGIACLTMGLEVVRSGNLDLGSAYSQRSSQAQALLHGGLSQSSGIFKIGFICYPASYVYLARAILFERKPKLFALIVFGILPGVLAGLAMGGRAPIFNTIAYGFLAYRLRPTLYGLKVNPDGPKPRKINPLVKIAAIVLVVFAFNYFINVFVARANVVGGPEMMLQVVAVQWGVTFSGPGAELMIYIVGPATTYLIFVFVWYLVQGIIMSNALFVSYEGDALLGVYGIDILSAVMRRIDPEGVSQNFNYLLGLETYGFLPSAFGTLFVDYFYGGLIFVGLWGWLATVVYRNARRGRDPRWFLLSPFITLGIVFSLINTPLGFSNGFITHFWLLTAFFLISKKRYNPIPRQD